MTSVSEYLCKRCCKKYLANKSALRVWVVYEGLRKRRKINNNDVKKMWNLDLRWIKTITEFGLGEKGKEH